MRPSRACKPKVPVGDGRSGSPTQSKSPRQRRHRDQHHAVGLPKQDSPLFAEKPITSKSRAVSIRSQSCLKSSSITTRSIKSDAMPRGRSLLTVGNGPKLTKTGRVSKAKKGVNGAHSCGCGKTYSRAEHLRRHQQNHEKRLPCLLCGKTFHREDLFERHLATKHDSSNPALRRDSATSGSLISSPTVQAPQSASFSLPSSTSHLSPVASPQYHDTSHYASDNCSSEAPSRYTQAFVAQSTSNFAPSLDISTVKDVSSPSSMDPSNRYKASYMKDEPYAQPYFGDATFTQLQNSTTQPIASTYLTTGSALSTSGDVSLFSSFTFPASWPQAQAIYAQQHLADFTTVAFSSPPLPSPRMFHANASVPSWSESRTDVPTFTASTITSPSSSCAPVVAPLIVRENLSGTPYPLTFIGQQDKYGNLDLESPLEEQQLGLELSLKTKQHYLGAYWSNFDPFYPIIHKATHQPVKNPFLTAAMMAIGAQYSHDSFARDDARILHGKCLELIAKHKDLLSSGTRLDYMQAIFLVEIFTQFRAKRSPGCLSEVFMNMYAFCWKIHSNTGRSYVEGLNSVQPRLDDMTLKARWLEWTVTMGFSRLLNACYVLEALQALALARSMQSDPTAGLSLLVPAPIALWNALDHTEWQLLLQANLFKIVDIAETLDNIIAGVPCSVQVEPFHSIVLLANHAASILDWKHEVRNAPLVNSRAIHTIFDLKNLSTIEQSLYPHPNVLGIYHLIHLTSRTPLRALLATSGESWILSRRLSQAALAAASEFATLKIEMRTWTASAESAFLQDQAGDDIHEAVRHSLAIVRLCVNSPSATIAFGAEMALYYACLVLWAVTYSATSKASTAGVEVRRGDDTTFEHNQAGQATIAFCDFAETCLNHSLMDGIIPVDSVHVWINSVESVLRWSALALGSTNTSGNSLGELLQNVVLVLTRLADRGWKGDWF